MGDLAARCLARHEGTFQSHAEPLAEFVVISQRLPDAGDGRPELDGLFDAIAHEQPPGCILV